ncbi:MAG: A/G-specific adenine glycosylase [Bacteroidales bacterium]|nr:A/G-specific adenine glycosylase [Bacteroidales bacterium]
MNHHSDLSSITSLLPEWYRINKRDLPWRKSSDPYQIWLSEIILQQTRVEQGLPYFESILARFPNVKTLSEAPIDDLLKLWQGLGYYSRARNMHEAAKQVMNEFGGVFPSNYQALLTLKGIGEYTASAVASIAYKIPKAVVDGNVFRVLSRLFALDTPINTTEGKKLFLRIAEELLDQKHPDIHNQAMMEFGAIQCTPANPDCPGCPCSAFCMAYATGKTQDLPVKLAKAKKQERYFHYFFFTDGQSTWLQQRVQKDIWQGLWEFPLVESDREESIETLFQRKDVAAWTNNHGNIGTPVKLKHLLTHRIIYATFFPVHIKDKSHLPKEWKEIKLNEMDLFAVSRLMDLFIINNL